MAEPINEAKFDVCHRTLVVPNFGAGPRVTFTHQTAQGRDLVVHCHADPESDTVSLEIESPTAGMRGAFVFTLLNQGSSDRTLVRRFRRESAMWPDEPICWETRMSINQVTRPANGWLTLDGSLLFAVSVALTTPDTAFDSVAAMTHLRADIVRRQFPIAENTVSVSTPHITEKKHMHAVLNLANLAATTPYNSPMLVADNALYRQSATLSYFATGCEAERDGKVEHWRDEFCFSIDFHNASVVGAYEVTIVNCRQVKPKFVARGRCSWGRERSVIVRGPSIVDLMAADNGWLFRDGSLIISFAVAILDRSASSGRVLPLRRCADDLASEAYLRDLTQLTPKPMTGPTPTPTLTSPYAKADAKADAKASADDWSDVVLRCGDTRWNGHRVVLAARSSVMRTALLSGMREARDRTIVIPTSDVAVAGDLVGFIYTGLVDRPIEMESENSLPAWVFELYRVAHFFQMSDLTDLLESYILAETIAPELLLSRLAFADKYNLTDLTRIGARLLQIDDESFATAVMATEAYRHATAAEIRLFDAATTTVKPASALSMLAIVNRKRRRDVAGIEDASPAMCTAVAGNGKAARQKLSSCR